MNYLRSVLVFVSKLLFLICLLISCYSCNNALGKANQTKLKEINNDDYRVEVKVVKIKKEPVRYQFVVSGSLEPYQQALVSSSIRAAILEKLLVREGERVKEGQLLAILNQEEVRTYLKQAIAGVKGAEVSLQAIKLEYDRVKKLFDEGAASSSQYDKIKAQYDGAIVQLELAKSKLEEVKTTFKQTYIRAPFNGVISAILKHKGDLITMMPPTPIMQIVDDTRLKLKIRLTETMIDKISPGSPIEAKLGSTNKTILAKVDYINPSVEPNTRTFEAVAIIDNDREPRINPGISAVVTVYSKETHDSFKLPLSALITEGEDEYVYTVVNGVVKKVKVKTNYLASDFREVVEGLKEGDLVIVEGVNRVGEGSIVKVIIE